MKIPMNRMNVILFAMFVNQVKMSMNYQSVIAVTLRFAMLIATNIFQMVGYPMENGFAITAELINKGNGDIIRIKGLRQDQEIKGKIVEEELNLLGDYFNVDKY